MAMVFDFELLQKDFAYFRKDSNYTESDVKNIKCQEVPFFLERIKSLGRTLPVCE